MGLELRAGQWRLTEHGAHNLRIASFLPRFLKLLHHDFRAWGVSDCCAAACVFDDADAICVLTRSENLFSAALSPGVSNSTIVLSDVCPAKAMSCKCGAIQDPGSFILATVATALDEKLADH